MNILMVLAVALAVTPPVPSDTSVPSQDAAPTESTSRLTAPETVVSPQMLRDALTIENAPSDINQDTRVFLRGEDVGDTKKPSGKAAR